MHQYTTVVLVLDTGHTFDQRYQCCRGLWLLMKIRTRCVNDYGYILTMAVLW